MSLLHSWQTYLSADQRCEAAFQARRALFRYDTPSEGRYKRWVADVMAARRVAQDHKPGRYLDAAFARITAPRGSMAQCSATTWLDALKWTGCLLGTAVRQMVDTLACIVGAVVGLARLAVPATPWGSVRVDAPSASLQHSISTRLRDCVTQHLERYPLEGLRFTRQFMIDHERLSITVGDTPWGREDPVEQKKQRLLAYCDNDSAWAQTASMVLNQFPANCAFEALAEDGRMRLGTLPVQLWNSAGPPEDGAGSGGLHVVREGENLLMRITCRQRLALLQLGWCRADGSIHVGADSELHCDGLIQYGLTLRVPRPREQQMGPFFFVTGFDMQSDVRAPFDAA